MLYEVVLDTGETPNKCTIAPLSQRSDFSLFRVKGNAPLGPLLSPILLHPEGECLTSLRNSLGPIQGIASIDCVWRRLNVLLPRIEGRLPTLARIPNGFETAYPRHNKRNLDPTEGLATIEAIFVAAALVGNWDASLLSDYHFGRKFVELNRDLFLELGVAQAGIPDALPVWTRRPKHSLQRRQDRGKY